MKIKKYFSSLLLLLFIGGCGVTTITHKDNQLVITVDDKSIKQKSKTISKNSDNFGKLYLLKEILELNSNSIIVYEKIRLDNEYEFNFSTTTTIKHVFESRKVSQVYANKGLYLYQILLLGGQVLNLMVEEFDSQSMVLTYGMTTNKMRELFKDLEATPRRELIEKVVVLPRDKRAIKSKWSSKKIHFIPLITPLRLMPRL